MYFLVSTADILVFAVVAAQGKESARCSGFSETAGLLFRASLPTIT